MTPPLSVRLAVLRRTFDPTIVSPSPMDTPPMVEVVAAVRLRVTFPEIPPPVKPVPAVTPEIVPMPGGGAEIVPSGEIVMLAPAFTPPIFGPVGGNRLIVPEDMIGPPDRPIPVATKITAILTY
jgi:hypothetical protein